MAYSRAAFAPVDGSDGCITARRFPVENGLINGNHEHQLAVTSVTVVGLGYVGLPTALGLHASALQVTGLDSSAKRLRQVGDGEVDLSEADLIRLADALRSDRFTLTNDAAAIKAADAVIICVPTPVDRSYSPDLGALSSACASVVQNCAVGQTIILTSTSYVGTTRQLLIEPLEARGFSVGEDVHVAFSPERIDPGVAAHTQHQTPRVVGGTTPACAKHAAAVLECLTPQIHLVSSAEAAELTKLYENTFRAVTLALANEFADVCGALELDPIEVTEAAATKPYGFLATYPGPGVGGHCIPCDPHYLLWQLRQLRQPTPLTEQAMSAIAARPSRVVERALAVLSDHGRGMRGARVLIVGVSYKPGVRDLRESTALEIAHQLRQRGAGVFYHDPLIAAVDLPDGTRLEHSSDAEAQDWDLILVHTRHPDADLSWVAKCPVVLDATYRLSEVLHRHVV